MIASIYYKHTHIHSGSKDMAKEVHRCWQMTGKSICLITPYMALYICCLSMDTKGETHRETIRRQHDVVFNLFVSLPPYTANAPHNIYIYTIIFAVPSIICPLHRSARTCKVDERCGVGPRRSAQVCIGRERDTYAMMMIREMLFRERVHSLTPSVLVDGGLRCGCDLNNVLDNWRIRVRFDSDI